MSVCLEHGFLPKTYRHFYKQIYKQAGVLGVLAAHSNGADKCLVYPKNIAEKRLIRLWNAVS